MTEKSPMHFFTAKRSPQDLRSAIIAKRAELSAIKEKQLGLEKAKNLRQEQLERLLTELAKCEPEPTAKNLQTCPA